MKERIFMLVDERHDGFYCATVSERCGEHNVLSREKYPNVEEIRSKQLSFDNCHVEIDCLPGDGMTLHMAKCFNWKIVKPVIGEFPYIEFVNQLYT